MSKKISKIKEGDWVSTTSNDGHLIIGQVVAVKRVWNPSSFLLVTTIGSFRDTDSGILEVRTRQVEEVEDAAS